jgi:predicted amidophosphoribosyltransferase
MTPEQEQIRGISMENLPDSKEEVTGKWDFPLQNIKNICASCGEPFKNSAKHYIESGNYCRACCEIINKKEKEIAELSRKEKEKVYNRLKEV